MESIQPTHSLKIDLPELAIIFDNRDQGFLHFLDLKTGQIVFISEGTIRQLEEIYDDHFDKLSENTKLEAALQQLDLYEWEREELRMQERTRRWLADEGIELLEADHAA